MKYHITIDGVPYCQAPVYQLSISAGLTVKQMCDSACACGYGEKKAECEADVAKLAELLPTVRVEVAEGECGSDPWWSTEEGIAAQEMEYMLNDY